MEKTYSPFPDHTNKEPYPNSSQPQPRPDHEVISSSWNEQYPHHHHHHHRHLHHCPPVPPNPSSSSSSPFLYRRPPPIPYPYLHPPQPFMVNPPFSQPLGEPFWVGPAVQNTIPYSGQTANSFPGLTCSHSNYTNSSGSNLLVAGPEGVVAPDAWTTKIARSKRKMARQKSLNLNLSSSSGDLSAPSPHSFYDDPRNILSMHETDESSIRNKPKDPYDFVTADNKKLKVILKKELKNSDVGSLGRIVIPKREAEEHLPSLTDKEGIQVVIRDINSDRGWSVKYKFWSNNKSRMYVLENTGDFVKENGLQIGDTITLYEDKSHSIYFSIKKAEKSPQQLPQKPSPTLNHLQGSFPVTPTTTLEEEDAALALLIEQLRHREHQEVTLQLMDYPSSSSQRMEPAEHQTFNCFNEQDNNKSGENNSGTHFDEYYSGLDPLHGSNPCTFSFLDQWSVGSGEDQ